MPNFLSSALAPLGNLLRNSTMAKVVLVIVLLLLVLVVILPLLRKLKRKNLKEKETREIMRDLLTWRHLAQLVKGGEEHNKAKQVLSDKIVRINELLKTGFALAATRGHGLYSIPWYILLGEPHSGKSTLLAESELDMLPSAEEGPPASGGDEKDSLPVRIWLGSKMAVCDVGGSVFFDRWLNGSSAEWNYIVRQLCRYRRRKPLNGIIITIPADALLADDGALTNKKAILMANELGNLLRTSGMNLPCYVVVTKLDMVNGFREYAAGIGGELRYQALGFENDDRTYNSEKFDSFWEGLLDRLRSGGKQSMGARELFTGIGAEANRMEIAGKIYAFPENFARLRTNLHPYLSALFGEDSFHGTENTVFEGVYFTSATDSALSFSPSIAALAGKKSDDLVITGERRARPQAWFVRDALYRRIFTPSPNAVFTRNVQFRRHIPHYLLCALMAVLGAFWLFAARFSSGELNASLAQTSAWYDWLDPLLKKKTPFDAPVIRHDGFDRSVLDTSPLPGENTSSRTQFLYNAIAYRNMKITAPWGFKTAELFTLGFDPDMGRRDRIFIANQLHAAMVRMPVIEMTGQKFIEEENMPVTLDKDLRAVIHSFSLLDNIKAAELNRLFASNNFTLDLMLRYLVPDIGSDTLSLLTDFMPGYERMNSFTADMNYLYSKDYFRAEEASLNIILSSWSRFTVYPDSLYGKLRTLAGISEDIITTTAEIDNALLHINEVVLFPDMRDAVYQWKALIKHRQDLINRGRLIFNDIRSQMAKVNIPVAAIPSKRPADAFGDNLINTLLFNDLVLDYAVRDYIVLFNDDMAFVKQKTGEGNPDRLGLIISLQTDFESRLKRQIIDLRSRAALLRTNELLTAKVEDKPDAASLFSVTESILNLASAIEIPDSGKLKTAQFNADWQQGQSAIKTATDNYDAYVKTYQDNEKLKAMINSGRVMLRAEAYLNRYIVFNTALAFLSTNSQNIAATVEAASPDADVFSFSGGGIQTALGGLRFNRSYDPRVVKEITGNIAAFASLFAAKDDAAALPLFLRNIDPHIYEPEPFVEYLSGYIAYWGKYPDTAYVPASGWGEYKNRVTAYKSWQINAVLHSLYAKSVAILSDIPAAVLNENSGKIKNDFTASLNDRMNFLVSAFLGAEEDRMLASWSSLSADAEEAFKVLRDSSDDELNENYLPVYSDKNGLSIGWWNDFTLDGFNVLSRIFSQIRLAEFAEKSDGFNAWPLCTDASPANALTVEEINRIARLLGDMGAGIKSDTGANDPVGSALHPILFSGAIAQEWARTVYSFASSVADTQNPLVWTLSQPSTDIQTQLNKSGILATNRFRYVELSSSKKSPQRYNTYMNEALDLLQGAADDGDLTMGFFRASVDTEPAALLRFNNPWAIFNLYFINNRVSDSAGKNYIPLSLQDSAGQYGYFVQLSFNREIAPFELWYNGGTWPVLRVQNGKVQGSRRN
jgi:hypothetical protein